MRDDIPDLLHDAAADPKHTPDFDALAARGYRQHVAGRSATLVVAASVVVAASFVLWSGRLPTGAPVIGNEPTAPEDSEQDVGPLPTDPATSVASLASPRPVPDHPDPVVRAGAAGVKVDCDGPVHLGGWTLDAGGPSDSAADPQSALQAFLDEGLFGLPTNGYEQVASEPGRVLFNYQVEGRPKVAVIVVDGTAVDEPVAAPDGWAFETFATCNPAEYAPSADDDLGQTVWTDRDGNRVPTSTITSYQGAEHCDWQSVTFLQLDDQQYLRDPEHLLADWTIAPYNGDVPLPEDAVDTGYRRGNDQLWLAADRTIAYLVTDSEIEAWPATTDQIGCA